MKWILLILPIFLLSNEHVSNTTVNLKIKGVSSLSGNLMIAVYEDESKFPKFGKGDINIVHAVKSNNPNIKISDLVVGNTYAIAVFHDANGNKYLDKNFLGIPTEKYGFSNNARGTFGPPYYSDAKFKVYSGQTLSITIQ